VRGVGVSRTLIGTAFGPGGRDMQEVIGSSPVSPTNILMHAVGLGLVQSGQLAAAQSCQPE
jgi:hypothetical protein